MYLAYSVLGTTFLYQYYRMVTLSPYGTILEKWGLLLSVHGGVMKDEDRLRILLKGQG